MVKVKSDIKLKKLVKFLLISYDSYFDKSKFMWEYFKYPSGYCENYLYYDGKKILRKILPNNFKLSGVYYSQIYTFMDDYFWEFEEYVGDSDLCKNVFLKWITKNNI